jgi:hypothetical protein
MPHLDRDIAPRRQSLSRLGGEAGRKVQIHRRGSLRHGGRSASTSWLRATSIRRSSSDRPADPARLMGRISVCGWKQRTHFLPPRHGIVRGERSCGYTLQRKPHLGSPPCSRTPPPPSTGATSSPPAAPRCPPCGNTCWWISTRAAWGAYGPRQTMAGCFTNICRLAGMPIPFAGCIPPVRGDIRECQCA